MSAEDIVRIFGGRKALKTVVRSNIDFIKIVRRGLPTQAVRHLFAEMLITRDEIAKALQIPTRTFSRRMKSAAFEPIESEKLIRLGRVYAFAKEVFNDDATKATEWIKRPNRALGNVTPLSLLDSELGAEQVNDTLGRLQEGVIS